MATGDPTGADLCSVTVNANDLSLSGEHPTFTFDTTTGILSGKKYAIVAYTNSIDSDNDLVWNQSLSDGYPGGLKCISDDGASTWTQVSTRDLGFLCKAGASDKDTYFAGGFQQSIFDPYQVAQTFTASSSYTITAVKLPIYRTTATPGGTLTVSIRGVEGEDYSAPTKANTPTPTNGSTSVSLDQATLTWADGGGADTFDVYYGTESGNLTKVSDAQAGTSFAVTGITNGSPYEHLTTRYWRIDSTNVGGTTTGDEWSFTTIRSNPPTQTYFYATTGQYYQLLVQADGSYGDPPGVGVEDVDFVFLAAGYEANFIRTSRRLVAAANDKMWYEDI
jgi:hypothetical protein